MKVKVKELSADIELKSNGMELEIRTPDGNTRLGDCYVTMTGLTWCKGKTTKPNGVKLSWKELEQILKTAESKKAALKASKMTKS